MEWIFENFGYVFCTLVFAVCLGALVGYGVDWMDQNCK